MKKTFAPFIIIGIIAIVLLLIWWRDSARLSEYIDNPEKGDIYILNEDDIYAPIRIDRIESSEIWMLNYMFFFSDAVPDREQILDHEFDQSNHLIYERSELKKMYEEGKVVEIYRD